MKFNEEGHNLGDDNDEINTFYVFYVLVVSGLSSYRNPDSQEIR